jgi:NAD(P)-dependent dehydrogenase (short-subunit alcohol dehydrogenase family)
VAGGFDVGAWFNAPMARHSDQRAFVTGGTSGIGEAVVTRLTEEGARVVFTGRDEARGAAVAEATGAHFLIADVRDGAAVAASVAEALALLGGLEIAVLNAGVIAEATLSETTDEQ